MASHPLLFCLPAFLLLFQWFSGNECADMKDLNEPLLRKHIFGLLPRSHKFTSTNRSMFVHGFVAVVGVPPTNNLSSYLAARSALDCGAVSSYIFSTKEAVGKISNLTRGWNNLSAKSFLSDEDGLNKTNIFLRVMTSVIFSNGLIGSAENMSSLHYMVDHLKHDENSKHPVLIFDGDAIKFVCKHQKLLADYPNDIYLTPNSKELEMLRDAFPCNGHKHPDSLDKDYEHLKHIANNISPNATIIVKGMVDKIVSPEHVITCTVEGTNYRTPGQGDLLAGALGQFSQMLTKFKELRCPAEPADEHTNKFSKLLAAYAACTVTRVAGKSAYTAKGSDMTSQDFLTHFQAAINKSISADRIH